MAHVVFNAFTKDLLLFAKARCPAGRTLTAVKKRYRVFEPDSETYVREFLERAARVPAVGLGGGDGGGDDAAGFAGFAGGALDVAAPDVADWQPVKGLTVDYLRCHVPAADLPRLASVLNGMRLFAALCADDYESEGDGPGACAAVCESVLAGAPSDDVMDDDVARAIAAVSADHLSDGTRAALARGAAASRRADGFGGLGGLGDDAAGGGESSDLIRLASEIARDIDVAPLLANMTGVGAGGASDAAMKDMIASLQRKVHEKMESGDVDVSKLCREAQRAIGCCSRGGPGGAAGGRA